MLNDAIMLIDFILCNLFAGRHWLTYYEKSLHIWISLTLLEVKSALTYSPRCKSLHIYCPKGVEFLENFSEQAHVGKGRVWRTRIIPGHAEFPYGRIHFPNTILRFLEDWIHWTEKTVNKRLRLPLAFICGVYTGLLSSTEIVQGWDKTYCLQFVEKDFDVIHFFGDKTYKVNTQSSASHWQGLPWQNWLFSLTTQFQLGLASRANYAFT